MANAITLERCGHNSGYMKLDVRGKCPETGCCVDGEVPEHRGCLETGFDLQEVCRQFAGGLANGHPSFPRCSCSTIYALIFGA